MFGAVLAKLNEEVSKDLIARAFARWDQRFREDPKAFQSDAERFLQGQTTEEYGSAAGATFIGYLNEVATEEAATK